VRQRAIGVVHLSTSCVLIITMLRATCVLVAALAACAPRTGARAPLVEPPPTPLPAAGILPAGEQMSWEIYWGGILVGNADLAVTPTEAHSRFSSTMLARTFAKVKYHLVSTLDRGRPTASREGLTMHGEASSVVTAIDGTRYAIDDGPRLAVPGGTPLHTLHTALASVRAWSRADDAPPAYLWFVMRHTLYRLDVERPKRGEAQGHRALEIHGMARALDQSIDPVDVTIWLSATPDRAPLRFVVVAGGERVSAELTETTARFAAI
jgi:hypothetical protein